jgi:predicted nuclease of restriction endonuclease-like RecB superfamily
MLTADLVRVRRSGGKLSVVSLKGASLNRAEELAQLYLELARDQIGNNHGALKEAWAAVEVSPKERKLSLGLQKLLEDRCEFEAAGAVDPVKLRSELFLAAAAERRELAERFERQRVFERLAPTFGVAPEVLEAGLFSDLRSQHKLLQVALPDGGALVAAYQNAQYQAVLLRATRVVAYVRCASVLQYRELFRALKFRRLLFVLHKEGDGYRIEIDGPFSLFDSVTKYGLALALIFPVLCRVDELRLKAHLRWGKERSELSFEYDQTNEPRGQVSSEDLLDDVGRLAAGINKLGAGWQAVVNERILDLPGGQVCLPDLCLRRGSERVYVEVLGFWSRDAVWRRVEMVQRGLGERIVFAVSSRLRVSEAVLGDESTAALYVYKGSMSARAVLDKVSALVAVS